MGATPWLEEWDAVVAGGTATAIEEAWLARLERGVDDPEELLEALRRLRAAGKKTLSATLLELASEQALADGRWEARKRLLAEQLRLGVGEASALRVALEEAVRQSWAGRPSLAALLAHFRLPEARKPLEALEQLELWLAHDVGDVFLMAGRGPGRVVEANPQLGVLRLDFEKERRVPVPIEAAPKYLTPLPVGHFLRRRLEEREVVAREVAADPPGALAAVLASFGRPLSAGEIRTALEGLVSAEGWAAWWNRAKRNPRVLAEGNGTKVTYRLVGEGEVSAEIRESFSSGTLAQRIELARRHAGRSSGLDVDMVAALLAGAGEANEPAGVAWEATAVAARLGASAEGVSAVRTALLARHGAALLLREVGDASQRDEVLQLVRLAEPKWSEVFAEQLRQETNPKLLTCLAAELIGAGLAARVEAFLDEVFLHPQRYPAALVWACEPCDQHEVEALLDRRRSGPLLVRLADLAERREFSPLRARLREILSARGMAAAVIQGRLTLEQGRRLLQLLERPGELGEERRWLARAVAARFPELRAEAVDESIPMLASTVARLQEELRGLREREIPAVLKAIQVAREHGDLSENFEYHAARARQEYLSARAAALQDDLARARVVDPSTVDTGEVRVGTTVRLVAVEGGEERRVTILGPYEGNPEQGILSHGAEAAQQLLGRQVGEEVAFDGGRFRVAAITAAELPPS